MAYERGADGLSFFNFVYYRDHAVAPVREPPFQVLARVTNREWLAEQSQDYFLAQGCYYSQLPVQLAQGKAHLLEMDLAPPKRPRSASARLRVHSAAPLAGARVHVAVNDTSLEPTADVSVFYPCPVQVVRFGGDLTLVALGGETVVEYALRLKRELAGPSVWVAGYSNDVFTYLPSARVLQEGGYEAGQATKWGSLPGPFTASVEERLVAKVLEKARTPIKP